MDKIITLLPKRSLGFIALFLFYNVLYGQAPYCTPTYDRPCNAGDGFGVYINQFTLKKGSSTLLSDATGCNSTVAPFSYTNFTATTPSVFKGETYSFDIAFTEEGSGPTNAGYALWIDFNNDNDFADVGEQVASGLVAGTGTFTIPTTTTTGNHRMGFGNYYADNLLQWGSRWQNSVQLGKIKRDL